MSAEQLSSPHHVSTFAQRHKTAAKVKKRKKMLNCKSPAGQNVKGCFSGLRYLQTLRLRNQKRAKKNFASGDAEHSRAIKSNGCYGNLYGELKPKDAVIRKKG